MAVIKSGATSDQLTIDPTAKSARATLYDSAGREVSTGSKATFAASGSFTPAATPNDLAIIYGSASKTVRLVSFMFGATNTAAGSQQYFVQKKSGLPTGGVFVAAQMVPVDTDDTATATNVGHYTTDPTAGASAGNLAIHRIASPVPVPATFAGIVESVCKEMLPWQSIASLDKRVTLRGVNQGLAINFNDAALVAGQTHIYTIIWTEE